MPVFKGKIGEISMKSDHEVEWKIENVLSYTSTEDYFSSPDFCISGEEWYLQMYPNGRSKEFSGWISLHLLKRKNEKSSPIGAHCCFSVKKADGRVDHIYKLTCVFDDEGFGVTFLKRSNLQQSKMLASGTLTLNCTLRTRKDFDSYGSSTLSRNFADMFISKRGCDAIVKVKGEEFPVQKAVLSTRSPVFAATFETDMKEKATSVVEIEDFDPPVFREFLMYLYSGSIEDDSKNVLGLYKLADKYDVEDLKIHSLLIIMTSLTVENVLDAAVLANQFDEHGLMRTTEKFFIGNCKQIISSTKWDDEFLSENAAVANRLLKFMAKW